MIVTNDDILVAVADGEAPPRMVDLRGLSIRKASAYLDWLGLPFTIEGRGRVVKQSIRPGEAISGDTSCRLNCKPT
jgi:beta-lactam-binding protein with PASTA domain